MRNAFLRFCLYFNIQPVPCSKNVIAIYMSFLSRSLSANSIPSYLNVIRLMHLEAGFQNPLEDWSLGLIMKGIKRKIGKPPQQKLPITVNILSEIRHTLDLTNSKQATFWCACIVAFLGFFRKSTLLPKSAYKKTSALLFSDMWMDEGTLFIKVRHTKTIQFGQRELVIPFVKSNTILCPVNAMLHMVDGMVGHTIPHDQPLFSFVNKGILQFLTHNEFVKMLQSQLALCGYNVKMYSGHSFRRGGCSHAFNIGLSPLLIKLRGDWRSDAYQRYISVSSIKQLEVARAMCI